MPTPQSPSHLSQPPKLPAPPSHHLRDRVADSLDLQRLARHQSLGDFVRFISRLSRHRRKAIADSGAKGLDFIEQLEDGGVTGGVSGGVPHL